jgi:hypothetical protein
VICGRDLACDSGRPVTSGLLGTRSDLLAFFLTSARAGIRALRDTD